MSRAILILLIGCVVITDGCVKTDPSQTMRQQLQGPDRSLKVLAVYLPWFGDRSHMDVGYSSQDPKILGQQIEEARGRGISAFVVDWNGPRHAYTDQSFALLQQVASQKKFQVALLYNETEDADGQGTDEAIAAFDRAYDAYIGPKAHYRDAYLAYNNRPVIFIFPKRGHADWNRVREHVNQWATPPLLLYKDEPPAEFATAFDGYFPWVHPGHGGWKPDGSDWGQQYLENFYKTMASKYPGKIMVGAAWPGFDDSRAAWGLNRHIDPRCGKTFDDTWQLFQRSYGGSAPPPFLLIETWNDHEEGTAIEKAGSSPSCKVQEQVGSR